MANNGQHSRHEEEEEEDLFGSKQSSSKTSTERKIKTPSSFDQTNEAGSQGRDAALRNELDALRRMNDAVVAVTNSLNKAKANMDTVSKTVAHATALLDTWTRILSQTEHNQRLILNPAWQGASRDLADAEKEVLLQRRAQERREYEERQRQEAMEQRKRAQEEEQRRRAEAAAVTPSAKVRRGVAPASRAGRGTSRGLVSTASTPASGTTRGTGAARGTGRSAVTGYGRFGAPGTKNAPRGKGRGEG